MFLMLAAAARTTGLFLGDGEAEDHTGTHPNDVFGGAYDFCRGVYVRVCVRGWVCTCERLCLYAHAHLACTHIHTLHIRTYTPCIHAHKHLTTYSAKFGSPANVDKCQKLLTKGATHVCKGVEDRYGECHAPITAGPGATPAFPG